MPPAPPCRAGRVPPLTDELGKEADGPGHLAVHRLAGLGQRPGGISVVPAPAAIDDHELVEARAHGGVDRGEDRRIGPESGERVADEGLEIEWQRQTRLRGEVPEQGGQRHDSGVGDLLHRGRLIALLQEEPERSLADLGARAGLLPLAEADRRPRVRHVHRSLLWVPPRC
jgi:hypothetical protein